MLLFFAVVCLPPPFVLLRRLLRAGSGSGSGVAATGHPALPLLLAPAPAGGVGGAQLFADAPMGEFIMDGGKLPKASVAPPP